MSIFLHAAAYLFTFVLTTAGIPEDDPTFSLFPQTSPAIGLKVKKTFGNALTLINLFNLIILYN
jgi:hypothetical protein